MSESRVHRAVIVLAALSMAASPAWAFRWVDATTPAGIQFQHHKPLVAGDFYVGAGAAWLDFDGDGLLDLYLTAARDAADAGPACNVLYRNLGNGGFQAVAAAGGASSCDAESWGTCSADYDNDGDPDLYVTNKGPDRLYRNLLVETGTPGFVDATQAAGIVLEQGRNSSCSWGDFDADGNVDLFVQGYVHEAFFGDPSPPDPPATCENKRLLRNQGDGTFVDIAVAVGVAQSGCGLATTWSDYDNDGDVDLFVVNDFGAYVLPNRLFRNDGPDPAGLVPWRFTDVSDSSGFRQPQFGMGIAIGDIDRDGDLDYYTTNAGANSLKRNEGDGTFSEHAFTSGVSVVDHYSPDPVVNEMTLGDCLSSIDPNSRTLNVSWGTALHDFNNDGHLDLHVVSGWIGAPAQMTCGWPATLEANLTFRGDSSGIFQDVTAQVGGGAPNLHSRALAFADWNDDGILDLYLGNVNGPGVLARGTEVAGHWLKLHLQGTLGSRDACGARVEATLPSATLLREVDCGSSFLSSGMKTVHLGLGGADEVPRLLVRFLGGRTVELRDVAVGQTLPVREPWIALQGEAPEPPFSRGEQMLVDVSVRDLSGVPGTGWLSAEAIAPGGGRFPMLEGLEIGFGAQDERRIRMALYPGPQMQPGIMTIHFVLSDDAGEMIHQYYLDVPVQ